MKSKLVKGVEGQKIFKVFIAILVITIIGASIYGYYKSELKRKTDIIHYGLLESDIELLSIESDNDKEIILKKEIIISELEFQITEMKQELEKINNEVKEFRESELFINKYGVTNDELGILYRIVESEATSGNIESKINVTNVILNRVMNDSFPDDIESVVFQNRQFSPVSDGRYYEVVVTKTTIDAVHYALNSNEDSTYGSLYFMAREHSDESNVTWFEKKLTFVMKDNLGHSFYK